MKKHSRLSNRANAVSLSGVQINTKFKEAFHLHQQGRINEAQSIYEEIVKLQPKHFDALHLLGLIAFQKGNPEKSIGLIDKAIALHPKHAAFHINRGMALRALGQREAAVASYDKALAIDPASVEAHYNRGNALGELKRFEEAIASYDKVIVARPSYAEAHCYRGNALIGLNRLSEALTSFDTAILIKPGFAEAHYYRGNVLAKLAQSDSAIACYDQAISIKPAYAEAHFQRGNVLKELQLWDVAVASYDKAIAVMPNYSEAHFNRGLALDKLNQLHAAVACFDEAIRFRPDFAEAYSNRGSLHRELRNMDAAMADYDKAIAIRPDYAQAWFNKALLLLLMGNFKNGWKLYEWRWKSPIFTSAKRDFTQPLWLGDASLKGKTILLHGEQGFGDTIQLCRYAALVENLGARVLLEAPAPLLGLLQGLEGVTELIATNTPLPAFDYHCPLLTLPLALNTSLDTIPRRQGYLSAPSRKVTEWSSKLGNKTRRRIGLVWSGNITHTNDRNRSIPLSTLVDYLPPKDEYFSLQKEVRESDNATLLSSHNLRHFGDELRDFSDTAALCSLMDLVVSVDTSVAHVNAALGKPTWILLPRDPDWRWLMDRADSPWYSSVRLYRQAERGDWASVLHRISADLEQGTL